MTMPFKVGKCPSEALALTNKVYFNPADFDAFVAVTPKKYKETRYVQIKDFIYTYDKHDETPKGVVGMTSEQRKACSFALNDAVDLAPFSQKSDNMYIAKVHFVVDHLVKKKPSSSSSSSKGAKESFNVAELSQALTRAFTLQFFTVGQKFLIEAVKGTVLVFVVSKVHVADLDAFEDSGKKITSTEAQRGVLMNSSQVTMDKAHDASFVLIGSEASAVGGAGLLLDWDFEKMGVGGLDAEFNAIFRRAFASRIYPPAVMQKLGVNHVRGLLLYGPPGTGKTLIARQIGKMLNGREPKIVSGPEVLNKFVGQSEENIRKLFEDAEKEQAERGIESDLHIIIFDELDAICRARGSSASSAMVGDSLVNQLLAKIDGVNSLNNILVIGMTNRKELIDPALLRPGRLEVHVEISLPDANGRVQILRIHTSKMRQNGMLADDVDIEMLARDLMKNYSGAEIEGIVKDASSWALTRQVDPSNLKAAPNPEDLRITQEDFVRALSEVKPAFGVEKEEFDNATPNGIVYYSPSFGRLMHTCRLFVEQVHNSAKTPIVSVLLEGNRGSGKTAVAATLALQSGFPFVKLVTPDKLVGLAESQRVDVLVKAFEDAYKSKLSVLVIDDIERLIEYVPAVPVRFSNAMLQALAVLVRRPPPKGHRLLVLGCTAVRRALRDLQIDEAFDASVTVPEIHTPTEFKEFLSDKLVAAFKEPDLSRVVDAFPTGCSVGVKKLIMLIEMSRQGKPEAATDRFIDLLTDYASKKI